MQNRQITLTRLIAAPPETVWRCWTDPAILPQWFGPDGTVWANRHRFTLHHAPQRIEFLMDADSNDDTPYEVVVTLAPEQGGTRLTQTMTFPTQESRDGALAYGADRLGQTTLAKLETQAILLLPRSSS